jgi:hypothetical protein
LESNEAFRRSNQRRDSAALVEHGLERRRHRLREERERVESRRCRVRAPGRTRLEENLGAADVALTADDLREIDAAASRIELVGARYSEAAQRMIDR